MGAGTPQKTIGVGQKPIGLGVPFGSFALIRIASQNGPAEPQP
jgi:hypothetical protein